MTPLLAAALLGPTPAAAADEVGSYDLRLRAAAVTAQLDTYGGQYRPNEVTPGAGHTAVDLTDGPGWVSGTCEAVAGGAYTDDLLQRFATEGGPYPLGFDPPDDDQAFDNPTVNRHRKPDFAPGAMVVRPGPVSEVQRTHGRAGRGLATYTREGPGVHWSARCDTDTSGRATATDGELPGVRTAGSTVSARLDRRTLLYTGTARAFLADVATAAGSLDLVSSTVIVRWAPGRKPRVGYRVTATDGSVTSVVASATDVPVSRLAAEFIDATSSDHLGLTLLAPESHSAPDGTWTVHAPALELRTGVLATRLVSVSFSARG